MQFRCRVFRFVLIIFCYQFISNLAISEAFASKCNLKANTIGNAKSKSCQKLANKGKKIKTQKKKKDKKTPKAPKSSSEKTPTLSLSHNISSAGVVSLKWTFNSNFTDFKVKGYEIKRSLLPLSNFQVIKHLPSEATGFVDENIEASTNYYYQVSADISTAIIDSPIILVTTGKDALKPITTPRDLVGIIEGYTLEIKWLHDGIETTGYSIEYSKKDSPTFYERDRVDSSTRKYQMKIAPDNTYYFRVRAFNQEGFSNYSNTFQIYVPMDDRLAAPSSLTLVALFDGKSRAQISWDDNSSSEDYFKVSISDENSFHAAEYAVGANKIIFETESLYRGHTYYVSISSCIFLEDVCTQSTKALKVRIPESTGWHHKYNPYDVDANGVLSIDDADIVLQDLIANGARSIASKNTIYDHDFLDVNDDGFISPIDVMTIINYVNQEGWHNQYQPMDVNLDGVISEEDTRLVIDKLNLYGGAILEKLVPTTEKAFVDVNNDGMVSPIDVVLITNYLESLM